MSVDDIVARFFQNDDLTSKIKENIDNRTKKLDNLNEFDLDIDEIGEVNTDSEYLFRDLFRTKANCQHAINCITDKEYYERLAEQLIPDKYLPLDERTSIKNADLNQIIHLIIRQIILSRILAQRGIKSQRQSQCIFCENILSKDDVDCSVCNDPAPNDVERNDAGIIEGNIGGTLKYDVKQLGNNKQFEDNNDSIVQNIDPITSLCVYCNYELSVDDTKCQICEAPIEKVTTTRRIPKDSNASKSNNDETNFSNEDSPGAEVIDSSKKECTFEKDKSWRCLEDNGGQTVKSPFYDEINDQHEGILQVEASSIMSPHSADTGYKFDNTHFQENEIRDNTRWKPSNDNKEHLAELPDDSGGNNDIDEREGKPALVSSHDEASSSSRSEEEKEMGNIDSLADAMEIDDTRYTYRHQNEYANDNKDSNVSEQNIEEKQNFKSVGNDDLDHKELLTNGIRDNASWMCGHCNYNNSCVTSVCEVCTKFAPYVKKWPCETCTFEHDKIFPECETCQFKNEYFKVCQKCNAIAIDTRFNDVCDKCFQDNTERDCPRQLTASVQKDDINKREIEMCISSSTDRVEESSNHASFDEDKEESHKDIDSAHMTERENQKQVSEEYSFCSVDNDGEECDDTVTKDMSGVNPHDDHNYNSIPTVNRQSRESKYYSLNYGFVMIDKNSCVGSPSKDEDCISLNNEKKEKQHIIEMSPNDESYSQEDEGSIVMKGENLKDSIEDSNHKSDNVEHIDPVGSISEKSVFSNTTSSLSVQERVSRENNLNLQQNSVHYTAKDTL